MLLGKQQAAIVSGYTWKEDGDVIEVPDDFGLKLLKISHAGFFHVAGKKPEAPVQVAPVKAIATVTPDSPSSLADALTTAAPRQTRGTKSKA